MKLFGSSAARLPAIKLPALHMPALRMPAIRLPAFRLPTMQDTPVRKAASKVLTSVLLLAASATMITAMADNVHIYEIYDGREWVEIRTFSTEPADILRDAGYSIDDYEIVSEALRGDELIGIRISRKFPVVVYVDDAVRTLDTVSKTVGELFLENGIPIGAADIVTPAVSSTVNEDMEIHITRVNNARVTEYSPIPFTTEKRYNKDLAYGKENELRAGVEGTYSRSYDVTYHNGLETSRELVGEATVSQQIPRIIEIGTAGAVITENGEVCPYTDIITVEATAYSTEGWRNKHTYIGTRARIGAVAVDPDIITLGSKLYITSLDGEEWIYGTAVAEDTGSAIIGNRVDLYFDTQEECERFGRSMAKIYVLSTPETPATYKKHW